MLRSKIHDMHLQKYLKIHYHLLMKSDVLKEKVSKAFLGNEISLKIVYKKDRKI